MKWLNYCFHKSDVYQVFSPFFVLHKLFGLGAFRLKSNKIRNSFCDLLWLAIILSYCLCTTYNFQYYKIDFGFSKVLDFGFNAVQRLVITFVLTFLIANFVQRRKFQELFQSFCNFDNEVSHTFIRREKTFIRLHLDKKFLSND